MNETPEQTLQATLDKPPADSKKFTMVRFGVLTILGVFAVSAALFMLGADAGQVVVLGQVTVGSISGLIGIYCGAQSVVEFKNSASLAAVVESRQQDTTETRKQDITITERKENKRTLEFDDDTIL